MARNSGGLPTRAPAPLSCSQYKRGIRINCLFIEFAVVMAIDNLPPTTEAALEMKTLIKDLLSTDRECKEQETRSLLSTEEGTQEAKFSGGRPFKAKSTFFGPRIIMVVWTSIGLAVAVLHHFLCRRLNGLPAQDSIRIKKETVTDQQIINAAGNTMALIVQTSFNAAIGIFFIQQFWSQIRRHSFSAKRINTIIDVAKQPLFFFKLFLSAFPLCAIAFIAWSMTVITVAVPGSLTVVQSNFTHQQDCRVPLLQLQYPAALSTSHSGQNNFTTSSLPAIRNLAGIVLLLRSYLPPPTTCGQSQCSYNIKFDAPAINCTDLPPSSDIGSMDSTERRQETSSTSGESYPGKASGESAEEMANSGPGIPVQAPTLVDSFVWNATYSLNTTGLALVATWRSGDFKNSTYGLPNATQCVAYIATYNVNVTHGISTSTMEVSPLQFNRSLALNTSGHAINQTISMFAIVDALAYQLKGALSFDPSGNPAAQTSMASYTLGAINGPLWNWTTDPRIAIPQMMQNLSLSLLSVNLGNDPSQPTLGNATQACLLSSLTFQYDQLRLTGIYGATALVTILCVLISFWTIRENKTEETMDFSRWMRALVHQDLVDTIQSEELAEDTPLQACTDDGRLVIRR